MSLSVLQLGNYLLPLITVPYLVRVLQPTNYGLFVLSTSVIQYFLTVTNYGFNLTATRMISIERDNWIRVQEIVNTVTYIRCALAGLSLVVLVCLVGFVPSMRSHWLLFFVGFGSVVGNVMFPVWFFQGIEDMKYITILNLVAKLVTTVATFVIVRGPADYVSAAALQSMGYIIPGLMSLYLTWAKFGLRYRRVSSETVRKFLSEGFFVFVSGISIMSYTTYNLLIIGYVDGPRALGMFSVSNKIIQLVVATSQPVLRGLSPNISIDFKNSIYRARQRSFRVGAILAAIYLVGGLVLSIYASPIVRIIGGQSFAESAKYLRILSVVPVITIVAYVVINILMLNESLIRYSMYCYAAVGLLNVLTNRFVLQHFGLSGMAFQYVFVEVAVSGAALFVYFSRRLPHQTVIGNLE